MRLFTIFGDLARLARIIATLKRNEALDPVLDAMWAPRRVKRIMNALAWPVSWLGLSGDASLPPAARSLTALGPSYVKFGQLLSTRPDIAGDALARDLKTLQDKVPAFDDATARREIADQLGAPIEILFKRLDPPVAAASIAQVHSAVTHDGRRVAVKVLRPGVEQAFARDIRAFYLVAGLIETLDRRSRRLKPTLVVRNFENVVRLEMDLRLEASAGAEYGENVRDETGFRTPEIFWDLTSRRVLTTGWVDGVSLRDHAALRAQGVDLRDMAMRLVRLFLRTALRDGYFHADMHQGNMKVAPDGALVAYDFGIMGRIDAETRRTYAEILFSYITRDYRRGAEAHFNAGYVSKDHDFEAFAQALRSIGEPIVGRRASTISMSRVIQQLFDVTEQFGMETREELLLLQRSMVVVEGVARSLDPDFDMWEAARPEVTDWMTRNLGPRAFLSDLGGAARSLARLGPKLPRLAERLVEIADRGVAPPAARAANAAPASDGAFWRGVAAGATGLGLILFGVAIGAAAAAGFG